MMANCKQTMATVKRSVPLFLSSSKDVTGDTDETSFTVRLSPPLNISDQAKKVTAFIDSATIPYSFPNVSSSTSTVIVRIPLGAGQGNSGEVPLTLPTGATPFFIHLAIGLGLMMMAAVVLVVAVPSRRLSRGRAV